MRLRQRSCQADGALHGNMLVGLRCAGHVPANRSPRLFLRMMGPVGGPGTVFACSLMAALVGAGLGDEVAVVTDGELSGLNRGITVGQVMPEAACGGPLAVVREGERIRIDVAARRIDLKVDDLEARVKDWRLPERELRPGWLAIYSEIVQPIQSGAVLGRRKKARSAAKSL